MAGDRGRVEKGIRGGGDLIVAGTLEFFYGNEEEKWRTMSPPGYKLDLPKLPS